MLGADQYLLLQSKSRAECCAGADQLPDRTTAVRAESEVEQDFWVWQRNHQQRRGWRTWRRGPRGRASWRRWLRAWTGSWDGRDLRARQYQSPLQSDFQRE